MTSHPPSLTLAAAAAAFALAGCGQQAAKPAEAPAEVPAAPAAAPAPVAVAPAVDQAALKGLLSPDETLEVLSLDASGAASASGEVKGYKTTVYAVPVAQGQTLSVTFEPSNTNLYMNVVDAADTSGAAAHRGEVDGPNASVTAPKAGVYLIKPFQPRATARRGESGTFKLAVAVK
ncbi:PPC domain-containing protein [Phenylobacterium sp. 58.2.17]|uniref:PPC domain-containing protein n=1 Tax=Phenylobacterium sp. 58.2.17 TaxID=2969306 RepID=UPI0022642C9E|nr:PPC domain-containing protein [Phenylobacterium sp. 58.2.17]MCX7586953.1 PPC domain-containing protein [Phenylobacterium sp. 58.2.17]